ncbi:MAG: SH3 domain-containing protein [Thermodesulfobacteriota bacterium]|nr:SH3 domain-containing protein [Thermodesulfobacteriota bacterium]
MLFVANVFFLSPLHAKEIQDNLMDLFLKANKNYKKGAFYDSAKLYEEILHSGIKNGIIYYNLGNCYFKIEKLGKAIRAYRNAQLYLPRDEDLEANINYARQLTKDKIEGKNDFSIIKSLCFWYTLLSLKEVMLVFIFFNFLLWGMLIIKMFKENELINWLSYSCLIFFLIFGITLGVKWYVLNKMSYGIVTEEEILIRAGNSENSTVLFKLHDGTEFIIEGKEGDWYKIKIPDGKRGWVKKDFCEVI